MQRKGGSILLDLIAFHYARCLITVLVIASVVPFAQRCSGPGTAPPPTPDAIQIHATAMELQRQQGGPTMAMPQEKTTALPMATSVITGTTTQHDMDDMSLSTPTPP